MNSNLIQKFVDIMSQFDTIEHEDIEYDVELLYNELSNVPSTSQTVELSPNRRKVVKAVRHTRKKPTTAKTDNPPIQYSTINIAYGSDGFAKKCQPLIAKYCNDLIDFVVARNRQLICEKSKVDLGKEKDEKKILINNTLIIKDEPKHFEDFLDNTLLTAQSQHTELKSDPSFEKHSNKFSLPDYVESENTVIYVEKLIKEEDDITTPNGTFENKTVLEPKSENVATSRGELNSSTKTNHIESIPVADLTKGPKPNYSLGNISSKTDSIIKPKKLIVWEEEPKQVIKSITQHNQDATNVLMEDGEDLVLQHKEPVFGAEAKRARTDEKIFKYNDTNSYIVTPLAQKEESKQVIEPSTQHKQDVNNVYMEDEEDIFLQLDEPVFGADAIRARTYEVFDTIENDDRIRMTVDKVDQINDTLSNTTNKVRDYARIKKKVGKRVKSSVKQIKEQEQNLKHIVEDIHKASKIGQTVNRLKNEQERVGVKDIEWAKLQAQIQSTQMEHELKIQQIQCSIAIAEINAKSQAHNVNVQYDIGLGKLKMDEWKTQWQTTVQRQTQNDNHEHQLKIVKVQADIDNEKQKQTDWYTSLENERDRLFKRELQERKDEQVAKMNFLDKQFLQFQELERQRHETNLKERWEQFTVGLQKLKDDHTVLLETRKQEFSRQNEVDRKNYEFDMLKIKEELVRERENRKYTEDAKSQERTFMFQQKESRDKMLYSIDMNRIKQDFAEKIQKGKEESEREITERKQHFMKEMEEKRLASNVLLASQKENIEKYKADLMAEVKKRQIEKQDENEKLKLQMKLAEYELKARDSDSKVNVNKYQFRIVPVPISTFEFQMERSAETVPHNIVRSFEQLWNTQYESNMDLSRVLRYKSELISSAKKALENFPTFRTYVTEDLPNHLLQSRIDYCRFFQRQGMFLFKIAPPFTFTKHRLEDRHIVLFERRLDLDKNIPEFVHPRYRVVNEGLFIIDALEFMIKELVFPSNAEYNFDFSSWEKILYKDRVILCPEVVRNIFYNIPIEEINGSFRQPDHDYLQETFVRRSSPIYISDNRIILPDLRTKKIRQRTRVHVFS